MLTVKEYNETVKEKKDTNSSENNNVNTVVFLSVQYTFVDIIYSGKVPQMQSMQMQRVALGQSVPKWPNIGHLMVQLELYELLMCEGLMSEGLKANE